MRNQTLFTNSDLHFSDGVVISSFVNFDFSEPLSRQVTSYIVIKNIERNKFCFVADAIFSPYESHRWLLAPNLCPMSLSYF